MFELNSFNFASDGQNYFIQGPGALKWGKNWGQHMLLINKSLLE